MDTAAYMSEDSFHVLLDEEKWNLVDLRDKRYTTFNITSNSEHYLMLAYNLLVNR
jgi:hypothetical protein